MDVPPAELGRDVTEMALQGGLALVHDERDAANEKHECRQLEPHVSKIGNGVRKLKSGKTPWPAAVVP
jgi:hypothetical protein